MMLTGKQVDYERDELDGVLFRFWIRAASYPGGWPMDLMRALRDCKTPEDYRKALLDLAQSKGANLPLPCEALEGGE